MFSKRKYSSWIMAFLFAVGVIIVYKTVDNLNFVFDFLHKSVSAISPIITGFIISYLLNIPIVKLESVIKKSKSKFLQKHSKGLSIAAIYILIATVIIILLRIIIPAFYKNIVDLYASIPYYGDLLINTLQHWQDKFDLHILTLNSKSIDDAMRKLLLSIDISEFGKYAQGIISATSGLISVFISITASIYMLFSKNHIANSFRRILHAFFKKEQVESFVTFIKNVNNIFSKYIYAMLVDALIVGILSTIILSIIGVKYAIILGFLIGLMNLIPYFGATISGVLVTVITLLTGGISKGIWTGITLIILQQVDGNFIGPKIEGEMLEVSPLLIITSVTLGGGLFGIWGMLLSVPVALVVKMLVGEIISHQESKKGDSNE